MPVTPSIQDIVEAFGDADPLLRLTIDLPPPQIQVASVPFTPPAPEVIFRRGISEWVRAHGGSLSHALACVAAARVAKRLDEDSPVYASAMQAITASAAEALKAAGEPIPEDLGLRLAGVYGAMVDKAYDIMRAEAEAEEKKKSSGIIIVQSLDQLGPVAGKTTSPGG